MNASRCANQIDAVKAYLLKHGSIDTAEAFLNLGVQRLSAVIYKLRHDQGLNIISDYRTARNRYGNISTFCRYIIEQEEKHGGGKVGKD